MYYRLWHKTTYRYNHPVTLSHNQIRVMPRPLDYQSIRSLEVQIEPEPRERRWWSDPYGNVAEFFSIESPHDLMSVTATSLVVRRRPDRAAGSTEADELARRLRGSLRSADLEAKQFLYPSRHCTRTDAVDEFASTLDIRQPVDDLCCQLLQRIHDDFSYRSASTTIETTVDELLERRQGVCQDFAHLAIAVLRSLGIPARYVSGYILTRPPPGQPRLIGADASHAWVSAYVGGGQWCDYDPTNNCVVGEEHITTAWGRDYADVSPVQGVMIGGGTAKLSVNVDMAAIDEPPGP